jgi:proline dehydrogenase
MLMRRILLYLSTAGWAKAIITHLGAARRVARRFVAGETLDDAVQATRALNAKNMAVSLDYLGESVKRREDTEEVVRTYRDLLGRIQREKLDASISLKLTHMGLDISEELCQTNLRHILGDAKQFGIPVTIDMENTPYTDRTLMMYRMMRDEYDFSNVGTVFRPICGAAKPICRRSARKGRTSVCAKGHTWKRRMSLSPKNRMSMPIMCGSCASFFRPKAICASPPMTRR